VLQAVHRDMNGRGNVASPAPLLHAARRPEALAAVFRLAPHVEEGDPTRSNRTMNDLLGSAKRLLVRGEPVASLGRLEYVGGPRAPFPVPGRPVAVEDPRLSMAEQLHQPVTHRGRVPVEDHDGLASDARCLEDALDGLPPDGLVLGIFEVLVYVPQDCARDVA